MKPNVLSAPAYSLPADLALLLMRLVVGSAFIIIGWGKIQHPASWMGPDSSFPGFFQALAAISEFCGGIALILGLLTRLAGFGIACTMIVAVYMHKFSFGDPFVNLTGGGSYQQAATYGVVAILMLAAGAGRFSLDHLISKTIARS